MLCYALTISSVQDLEQELQKISCDPAGIAIMREKLSSLTIKVTELKGYCALALKEASLSAGAECALPKKTIRAPEETADVILLCTTAQLKLLAAKCAKQAFEQLRKLSPLLLSLIRPRAQALPQLMGILNITPDSFSDGGKFMSVETALEQTEKMLGQGTTIIDIGGESTRPGAIEVSAAEELQRVIPVLTAIHKKYPQAILSIDTTKSAVARAAVNAGATMINDISGLTRDPEIARVAAETGAKLILMHRLGPSDTMQNDPRYQDILKEILLTLSSSLSLAKEYGVRDEQLIIDPGIGFGKTREQNLYLIKNLSAFTALGYPVLLGASRKSFIGLTLDKPATERTIGTAITSAYALPYVDYIRVHDITPNQQALVMAQAILGAKA